MNRLLLAAACVLGWMCGLGIAQTPLGTAFTYQGELRSAGVPAAGLHDLRFSLYEAAEGGKQWGETLCADNVSLTEGRFTVSLNFGAAFIGEERYLEIQVRADTGLDCTNAAGFVTLKPRQPLRGAPNALFSLGAQTAAYATAAGTATTAATATTATTATNSTQLNGQSAAFYQNASNLTSGTLSGTLLGGAYSGALTFSNAANTFTGSGSGLTGLNASNLAAGTLNAARLPVPLMLSGDTIYYIIRGTNTSTLSGASGVSGYASATTGYAAGVWGASAGDSGAALFGDATSPTGINYGVYTRTYSSNGRAAFGWAMAGSGPTYGGYFASNSTGGQGVYGEANASSGTTYGVHGSAGSPDGYAGYFDGRGHFSGNVGIGTANPASRLHVEGSGADALLVSNTGLGRGATINAANDTALWVNAANGWAAVDARNASGFGYGVYALSSAATGTTYGVYSQNNSTSGVGVLGHATAATGATTGVFGQADSPGGTGVYGLGLNGVVGETASTYGYGLYAVASASTGYTFGASGRSISTSGRGVYGIASAGSGSTYGVLGQAYSPSGYGVYSYGNTGASGTKSFRIDHPDDPENKYLLHYSTESPEVLNAYSGTIRLDGTGEAVVELPAYFAKINKDPRYLLTAIGAPMPMLHVAEEIDESALSIGAAAGPDQGAPLCFFRIAGGEPLAKVSWEVKAVRNDHYVRQHGAPVEVEKQDMEKGRYQHPDLYGQPAEKSMNYDSERAREHARLEIDPAPAPH